MRSVNRYAGRAVAIALVSTLLFMSQGSRAGGGVGASGLPALVNGHAPSRASNNSASYHTEQASSAAAFVDSVGVQTHINYIDTPYADWQRVLDKIVRLGVHHIRDALPMSHAFVDDYRQLAAHGIRCTCGFAYNKDLTAESIVNAARSVSDVEALEAPNECDAGTNCGGGGKSGIANVVAFLPVVANAARSLQVPAIGPSFTRAEAYASTGPIASWITSNNLHVYFGGRHPGTEGWGAGDARGHRYGSLDWWLDQANLNAPGLPVEITETGYEAFDHPARAGTIPADVEAAYLLRTLLLDWNHGVRRTFIYELLDEFPGSGYGLLRHDLTEKPAYLALRNLLLILNDSSKPIKPGHLAFSIECGDPSVSHTLLQKSDGSYDLILWLERSGYDASVPRNTTPSPAESVQVKIDPAFGVSQVVSFNGDGSTESQNFPAGPSMLTATVNDRLKVLHILAH